MITLLCDKTLLVGNNKIVLFLLQLSFSMIRVTYNPHLVRVLTVAGQVGQEYWNQNCRNAVRPKPTLYIEWQSP